MDDETFAILYEAALGAVDQWREHNPKHHLLSSILTRVGRTIERDDLVGTQWDPVVFMQIGIAIRARATRETVRFLADRAVARRRRSRNPLRPNISRRQ